MLCRRRGGSPGSHSDRHAGFTDPLHCAPKEAALVPLLVPVVLQETARVLLPGLVVLAGAAACLWVFGRTKAGGALGLLGFGTVLASFVGGVAAFGVLEYLLHWSFSLDDSPLWYRATGAVVSAAEGLGILLVAIGATVGPRPDGEDE